MFSRSENPDEILEPAEESSGEKSPLVMAGIAGLLAVFGAFLLVWYLSGNDSTEAVAEGAGVTNSADGSVSSAAQTRQVLIVTQNIPRGTSVRELIDAPTVYLSAQAIPENFIASTAIETVAELQELDGWILGSEAIEGEQLLIGRFRDPADFDANNETFLEAATGIEAPDGHHVVSFELPTTRANGGNIRAGERVAIVSSLRATPAEAAAFSVSVVALNSVEVLAITSALEVAGELSQDVNQFGVASRGNLVITVAVEPDELADLVYAIEYTEIVLASALPGLENEDGPKAVTTLQQVLGEDGVWLEETEDGNLVDLLQLFNSNSSADATSIELELPSEDAQAQGDLSDEPSDDISDDLFEDAGDS